MSNTVPSVSLGYYGVLIFFSNQDIRGTKIFFDGYTGLTYFSRLGHTGYKDIFRGIKFFLWDTYRVKAFLSVRIIRGQCFFKLRLYGVKAFFRS